MGGIPREAPFHDRLKCLKGNLYTCLHTYLRDERLEPKTERKRVRRARSSSESDSNLFMGFGSGFSPTVLPFSGIFILIFGKVRYRRAGKKPITVALKKRKKCIEMGSGILFFRLPPLFSEAEILR